MRRATVRRRATTLVLVLAVGRLSAGEITVTGEILIPGYTVVRSSYVIRSWTSGPDRYTERGAYTEQTFGGPNDGHVVHVTGNVTVEPAPTIDPGDTTGTVASEVIDSVPDSVETTTVTHSYPTPPGVSGPGDLTLPGDITDPPFSEERADDLLELPEALTTPTSLAVAAAAAAALASDSLNSALVDGAASEANQVSLGDPVLVSTGELTESVTDLTLVAGSVRLELTRTYRSNVVTTGSLGVGWFWSLDSRIVLGESRGAVAASSDALAALEAATGPDGATAVLAHRLRRAADERSARITRLLAAAATARSLESALRAIDYHGPLGAQLLAEAGRQANQAAAVAASLEHAASGTGADRTRIDTVIAPAAVSELSGRLDALDAEVGSLTRAAGVAYAREAANARYATVSHPDMVAAAGNASMVVIGFDGHFRRYTRVDDDLSARGDEFTLARPDGTIVVYGAFGELRRIEDRNGNGFVLHYDQAERLSSITDTRGRAVTLHRDDAGRVSRVEGPEGASVGYEYTAGSRLASVTDLNGARHRYEYGGGDGPRLVRTVNPDGSSRSYSYETVRGALRVTSTVDEEGYVERFDFSVPGRTVYTNPGGVVTTHRFDSSHRVTRIEYADGAYEEFSYDAAGNTTRRRARDGGVTTWVWERDGAPSEKRHPDGTLESWGYTPAGQAAWHIDRRGSLTRYTYDARDNLIRVDHPDGSSDRFARVAPGVPAAGEIAVWIDRRGNRIEYTFDHRGHVQNVRDSIGEIARFTVNSHGRVTSMTDANGEATVLSYRPDGRVRSVRGPLGMSVDYDYSIRGDVTSIVENGRTVRFEWDRRHLLRSVTNALGEEIRYEYRCDGLPLSREVRAGAGHAPVDGDSGVSRTEYTYDARGLLASERHVGTGSTTRYEHDAAGRVSAVIDAAGARTEYRYDSDGQPTAITRYLGTTPVIERLDYEPGGELRSRTDPRGARWSWEHDPLRRETVARDPLGSTWVTAFDPLGLKLAETAPDGVARGYRYDLRGRLIEVLVGTTTEATYEYDALNRLARFTDGEGATWSYRYDARGFLTAVAHPDGALRTFAYNADGTRAVETDETGRATLWEYDAIGRPVTRTDPSPAGRALRTRIEWHYLGGVARVTDPTGRIQTYHYDDAGRTVGWSDGAGARTSLELDALGRTLALTDPSGMTVAYEWDALGRLEAIREAGTITARYAYDHAGNLTAETDGAGRSHRYVIDAAGRVIEETNAIGAVKRLAYDAAGRLASMVDFTGVGSIYEYDERGRPSAIRFSDGTVLEYRYDRAGRMVAAANEHERLEFDYDSRGRLVRSRGSSTATDVAFEYDGAGRRVARVDRAVGDRVDYAYDERGFLRSVESRAGRTTLVHDDAGRLLETLHPNGVTDSVRYDAAGRVRATVSADPRGTPIFGVAHVYDAAGKRLYDVDHTGAITGYSYDPAGRIARVEYPCDGAKRQHDHDRYAELGALGSPGGPGSTGAPPAALPEYLSVDAASAAKLTAAFRDAFGLQKGGVQPYQRVWTEEFEYNAAGDRVAWLTGWGRVEYTYDAGGRLVTAGRAAYDHDVAGNLIGESDTTGLRSYRYSAQHRLISATSAGSTVGYEYDALGRRISRSERIAATDSAPAADPHELRKPVRGGSAAGDVSDRTSYRLVFRYDGAGRMVSSFSELPLDSVAGPDDLIKPIVPPGGRYTPGPATASSRVPGAVAGTTYSEVSVAARTLSVAGPDSVRFQSHDVLGSVRSVTTAGGVVVSLFTYDAYGSSLAGPPSRSQRYGFSGKAPDPTTGLLDFGFRDYASTTGRFTSADPVKAGTNWFIYVNADPINFIDPWGLIRAAAAVTFDLTLTYTRSTQTLSMTFHELHNGQVVDTTTAAWDASNSVKERVPGQDAPVWFRGYLYYPGPFPLGEWNITATGVSDDPRMVSTIRTDAVIDVQTYVRQGYTFQKGDVLTNQDGFLIHGGGYTSNDLYDPAGFNRYQDNTRGCLRMVNADVDDLVPFVDRSLQSGGRSRLIVTQGGE